MGVFKDAFKIVMGIEGGYANDPDDHGGETYKGISRKNFPYWEGWSMVDLAKKVSPGGPALDNLLESRTDLQQLVLSFYKKNFWDLISLDFINDQKICVEMFDTGVNMGTGVAAIFLQDSLNVTNLNGRLYPDLKVDGKIGPLTIARINAHPRPADVLKTMNIMQGARYIEICKRKPSQEKFYRSWLSRVSI